MGRPKKDVEVEKKENKEELSKQERLKLVMREICKDAKCNVVYMASEEPIKEKVPFGNKLIDEFTGGGIIKGNYSVIYGSEGTGKTTLVLMQIAEIQKAGGTAAYVDLEHTINKDRAIQHGVDWDKLIIIGGDAHYAEQSMEVVRSLAKEKVIDYIAVDSLNGFSPKSEQETNKGAEVAIEHDEMAALAKKIGKFINVTKDYVYQGKVAVVFIGQVRTQGIGGFATFEGMSGGHCVKHYSVFTMYLRKGQSVDAPTEKRMIDGEKKEIKTGFDCVLKIIKTKTNSQPEGSELHLPFTFKDGFQNI